MVERGQRRAVSWARTSSGGRRRWPRNSGPRPTRSVRGANTCQLSVAQPQGRDTVVVMSAIDNLVKGAAGQAVQAMNLMLDQPETTGLEGIALAP